MRRAALLYNPASGRSRERRAAVMAQAVELLGGHGVEAYAVPTRGPGTAGQQALEMAGQGCDVIFACGGDGTVNEVAQAMPQLRGRAAMGVLPLGTGNLLAGELDLPREPLAALRRQLDFRPRSIALGRVEHQLPDGPSRRFFVITAGVGADARLMYRVTAELKHRYGMAAYFLEMARLTLIHRFPLFEIEYADSASGEQFTLPISQMIAARVTRIGLVQRRLPIQASVLRPDLPLILLDSRNPLVHGAYLSGALLGHHLPIPGVRLAHASWLVCRHLPGERRRHKIYMECDGEFLGRLPIRMDVVPDAMDLLMPPA